MSVVLLGGSQLTKEAIQQTLAKESAFVKISEGEVKETVNIWEKLTVANAPNSNDVIFSRNDFLLSVAKVDFNQEVNRRHLYRLMAENANIRNALLSSFFAGDTSDKCKVDVFKEGEGFEFGSTENLQSYKDMQQGAKNLLNALSPDNEKLRFQRIFELFIHCPSVLSAFNDAFFEKLFEDKSVIAHIGFDNELTVLCEKYMTSHNIVAVLHSVPTKEELKKNPRLGHYFTSVMSMLSRYKKDELKKVLQDVGYLKSNQNKKIIVPNGVQNQTYADVLEMLKNRRDLLENLSDFDELKKDGEFFLDVLNIVDDPIERLCEFAQREQGALVIATHLELVTKFIFYNYKNDKAHKKLKQLLGRVSATSNRMKQLKQKELPNDLIDQRLLSTVVSILPELPKKSGKVLPADVTRLDKAGKKYIDALLSKKRKQTFRQKFQAVFKKENPSLVTDDGLDLMPLLADDYIRGGVLSHQWLTKNIEKLIPTTKGLHPRQTLCRIVRFDDRFSTKFRDMLSVSPYFTKVDVGYPTIKSLEELYTQNTESKAHQLSIQTELFKIADCCEWVQPEVSNKNKKARQSQPYTFVPSLGSKRGIWRIVFRKNAKNRRVSDLKLLNSLFDNNPYFRSQMKFHNEVHPLLHLALNDTQWTSSFLESIVKTLKIYTKVIEENNRSPEQKQDADNKRTHLANELYVLCDAICHNASSKELLTLMSTYPEIAHFVTADKLHYASLGTTIPNSTVWSSRVEKAYLDKAKNHLLGNADKDMSNVFNSNDPKTEVVRGWFLGKVLKDDSVSAVSILKAHPELVKDLESHVDARELISLLKDPSEAVQNALNDFDSVNLHELLSSPSFTPSIVSDHQSFFAVQLKYAKATEKLTAGNLLKFFNEDGALIVSNATTEVQSLINKLGIAVLDKFESKHLQKNPVLFAGLLQQELTSSQLEKFLNSGIDLNQVFAVNPVAVRELFDNATQEQITANADLFKPMFSAEKRAALTGAQMVKALASKVEDLVVGAKSACIANPDFVEKVLESCSSEERSVVDASLKSVIIKILQNRKSGNVTTLTDSLLTQVLDSTEEEIQTEFKFCIQTQPAVGLDVLRKTAQEQVATRADYFIAMLDSHGMPKLSLETDDVAKMIASGHEALRAKVREKKLTKIEDAVLELLTQKDVSATTIGREFVEDLLNTNPENLKGKHLVNILSLHPDLSAMIFSNHQMCAKLAETDYEFKSDDILKMLAQICKDKSSAVNYKYLTDQKPCVKTKLSSTLREMFDQFADHQATLMSLFCIESMRNDFFNELMDNDPARLTKLAEADNNAAVMRILLTGPYVKSFTEAQLWAKSEKYKEEDIKELACKAVAERVRAGQGNLMDFAKRSTDPQHAKAVISVFQSNLTLVCKLLEADNDFTEIADEVLKLGLQQPIELSHNVLFALAAREELTESVDQYYTERGLNKSDTITSVAKNGQVPTGAQVGVFKDTVILRSEDNNEEKTQKMRSLAGLLQAGLTKK